MWTKYFLKEQGYKLNSSILYQDNQSSILLEKNGKASSTKQTRHINIRYFYVTDLVSKPEEKVHIEYMPTDEMIGDYFTKPLMGAAFKKMRNLILNIKDEDKETYDNEYDTYMKKKLAKLAEQDRIASQRK